MKQRAIAGSAARLVALYGRKQALGEALARAESARAYSSTASTEHWLGVAAAILGLAAAEEGAPCPPRPRRDRKLSLRRRGFRPLGGTRTDEA